MTEPDVIFVGDRAPRIPVFLSGVAASTIGRMKTVASLAVAMVLGAAPWSAYATLVVVPQAKTQAGAGGDDARRESTGERAPAASRASGSPAPAPVPRARAPSDAESKCSEALTTLSLGIDDAAARDRLKSRDCK